ncbi:uncharacterized protein BN773_00968 [Prevotella sp. CAG:755]|nr:uncharacterized protein BN773_00968 [Prevotella sp. CAG:755]
MRLHVVGVRLALIPRHPAQGITRQRRYSGLEKIARLIRMTLQGRRILPHVKPGPLAHPRLDEVVAIPVIKKVGKILFDGRTRHPSLGRSATHRVQNKPYRHAQAVGQHPSEMVSHRRKSGSRLRLARPPHGGREVVQPVYCSKCLLRPGAGVRSPARSHLEKPQVGSPGRLQILTGRESTGQGKLHVRLAGAQPHFARHDIVKRQRPTLRTHFERVGCARVEWSKHSRPPTVRTGSCMALLSADAHRHVLSGVGHSRHGPRPVTLDHHAVRVNHRQTQPAEIARQCRVNRTGKNACALFVRMQGIGEELRTAMKRFIQVDNLHVSPQGDCVNGRPDLPVPVAGARTKAGVTLKDGSQPTNPDLAAAVGLTERIDKRLVIRHEIIAPVGPVARVGIVQPKMNHNEVGLVVKGLTELEQLHVRPMAPPKQCGTVVAEIAHLIVCAQQLLQLCGIGRVLTVGKGHAVSDAVTHTGHAKPLGRHGHGRTPQRHEDKEQASHSGRLVSSSVHRR